MDDRDASGWDSVPEKVIALCDAHEALEAEHKRLEDEVLEIASTDYPNTQISMLAAKIAERRRGGASPSITQRTTPPTHPVLSASPSSSIVPSTSGTP